MMIDFVESRSIARKLAYCLSLCID